MWAEGLSEEVRELFEILVVPDFSSDKARRGTSEDRSPWTGMHTGTTKDVGIRVRRVGRDPAKLEARREYQRERMRRIRLKDPTYSHKKKEAA